MDDNGYANCNKRMPFSGVDDLSGRYNVCGASEEYFEKCKYKGKFPSKRDDGTIARLCTTEKFLTTFMREMGIRGENE